MMIYGNGDSGQLCLNPHVDLKSSADLTLTEGAMEGEEMQAFIELVIFFIKPKFPRNFKMKG